MTSASRKWADQAHYDLDTAAAMLDAGRYLYVLFCCQQAVEKMLKAVIVKQTNEFPPRLHNLMRLAEVGSIEVTEVRAEFLRELSAYYVQTRYPEELGLIGGRVTRQLAKENFKKTEETLQWLSQML
jgi:HEPN domain-containing protein